MTRSIFRTGLAITGAAITLAATGSADAGPGAKAQLPAIPITVIGVDTVCSSFTASLDTNGDGVLTCVPISTTPPPPGTPTGCVATVNGTSSLTLPSSGGNAS